MRYITPESIRENLEKILEVESRYLKYLEDGKHPNKKQMIREEMHMDPTNIYHLRSVYGKDLDEFGYKGPDKWINFTKEYLRNNDILEEFVSFVYNKGKKQSYENVENKEVENMPKNEGKISDVKKEEINTDLLKEIEEDLNSTSGFVEEPEEAEKTVDNEIEPKNNIIPQNGAEKQETIGNKFGFWLLVGGAFLIPLVIALLLSKRNKEEIEKTKTPDEKYMDKIHTEMNTLANHDLSYLIKTGRLPEL